jgi:acetyl esterase/lipase
MSASSPAVAHAVRYDPEYAAAVAPFAGQPAPEHADVLALRRHTEELLHGLFRLRPWPEAVAQTPFTVASADGSGSFTLVRFALPHHLSRREPGPAVVYAHGGGMVACGVATFAPEIARSVLETDLPFWAVDYRLAPEHPAPAGAEDVFAALRWLQARAGEHGVDPARVVLAGDSGGGCVAAGACLLARDRGAAPPVAKMVLVYPMLDDRTPEANGPAWPVRPFLTWTERDNLLAWDAVLGKRRGKAEGVSIYEAPGRAEDLSGLPPTYIDVGGLDLFRDEDVAFAARLAKADVEVEFHLWPGVPHGFEGQEGVEVARLARAARFRAYRI